MTGVQTCALPIYAQTRAAIKAVLPISVSEIEDFIALDTDAAPSEMHLLAIWIAIGVDPNTCKPIVSWRHSIPKVLRGSWETYCKKKGIEIG